MDAFENKLKSISAAERLRDLWPMFCDYYREHGATMISYHAVSLDGVRLGIKAEGFPEKWVNRYISEGLEDIDPIPKQSATRSEPFIWSDAAKLNNLTDEERWYLSELQREVPNDGIAISVYGNGFQNAFIGVGFANDPRRFSRHQLFLFHMVAEAAHIRFCTIVNERRKKAKLSKRELEILHWVAKGKSNSVIATILALSPNTIDAHLRKIYAKLSVSDRTSAAIHGVGRGLIYYAE
ncbi:MAG: LuxR C-terminal-related transcriptional regulator [Pseudomonadota bacterium]